MYGGVFVVLVEYVVSIGVVKLIEFDEIVFGLEINVNYLVLK